MKFISLTKNGTAIALNRDAIAYVTPTSSGTRLYLRETDNESKMLHLIVSEPFDVVTAMLNAE